MAEKSWVQRAGLTPAKAAMVLILGLVLVVVVIVQLTGGADAPQPGDSARAKRPTRNKGPATARTQPGVQPARAHGATPAAPSRGKGQIAAGPRVSPASTTDVPPETAWKPWARPSLERTLQYNPLQQMQMLVPPAEEAAGGEPADASATEPVDEATQQLSAARQEAWQRLHSATVRMIVVGASGKWAYVGDELVREGDLIDGFVVESIDAQGVRFADPRAGQ